MYFKSKKITLLILGITAIACSRILLTSFNDPEGPNLLVIGVLALVVFLVSLTAYALKSPVAALKRLALAVGIQAVLVIGLYFFLR